MFGMGVGVFFSLGSDGHGGRDGRMTDCYLVRLDGWMVHIFVFIALSVCYLIALLMIHCVNRAWSLIFSYYP